MKTSRRTMIRYALGILAASAAGARGRPSATARAATAMRGTAQSVILLWMDGGPSHLDTWDPKPGRAVSAGRRAIRTSVPGIDIADTLPRLSRHAHRLAIVRSMTGKEGNHARARHLSQTSYSPQPGVSHPAIGCRVAGARAGNGRALPSYVSILGPGGEPGWLSPGFAPFVIGDPLQPLRYLASRSAADARIDERLALWRAADESSLPGRRDGYVAAHREVGERAVALMRAPERHVLDPSRLPATDRSRYGTEKFGVACLMARELAKAGVPFIEVTLTGWDTHTENFKRTADACSVLDSAMSTLLDDLAASGLLSRVLVLCLGEFGRTPDVNADGGRDHYPHAYSAVLTGAGVVGGQVIGRTDEDGRAVVERPVTVPDLLRTVAELVGLDPDRTETSPAGRPFTAVAPGSPLRELIGLSP